MTDRVAELLAGMSREQKAAQLGSIWVAYDPETKRLDLHRPAWSRTGEDTPLRERAAKGTGQLTRPFGSYPVEPAEGARALAELQAQLPLPAIAHDECLSGFMAHLATAFPVPLNLGSTWDPELVEHVGAAIASHMRAVGVHQGLAPLLDVVRDHRWGRVEECFGEDPHLVGMIGSAYVRGIETTGVVATPKHFAGYPSSEGGRNLAPAHLGPRELHDVFLPPFEMAIRLGGARAIMNAYQDIDGVPVAASAEMLTTILRERWDFTGIVVSDYMSIQWLQHLHGTAETMADAAAQALRAGLDVELPNTNAYGAPLLEALDAGLVSEADLDRSVERVLRLKEELGLLDGHPQPAEGPIDLDPPAHRELARKVATESIVLLQNRDDILPLRDDARIALVGPNAGSAFGMLGNYSFQTHVAQIHPEAPPGVAVVTVAGALGTQRTVQGCEVTGDDRSGFAEAQTAAREADVAVVVVGDQAGNFGRGTSGEGTDADDLRLPGVQEDLILAVAQTGTPTVVVLVAGRPYELERIAEAAHAILVAWFPGEEGGNAIADVLRGRANPCAKTCLSFGRGAGQQPFTYLHKRLSRRGYARSTTRPVFAFGHGLSYTTFAYDDLRVQPERLAPDGTATVSCTVSNTGEREGAEVVQLYVRDVVGSVTRPSIELKAFAKVRLVPGESARVGFTLPADLLSFTGVDLKRIVEPGALEVMVGASSADIRLRGSLEIVGDIREVGEGRVLTGEVRIS